VPTNMRAVARIILLAIIVDIVLAQTFEDVKIKLGKRSCTCDFAVVKKCIGKAKCDKKCSGKGRVEVGRYELDMKCQKGRCAVSNCQAGAPATEPTTGSGSEPGPTGSGSEPLTGSGSGPEPITGSGSGSGEEPVPITGTGSGSGPPMPPTGGGMDCSCQCSCPQGGGNCDCNCNCPARSPMVTCGSGFTKVCPMMEGRCPDMMFAMCPIVAGVMETRTAQDRMSHEGEGCQCVPNFILSMVPGMPPPGTPVAGRSVISSRAAVQTIIPFGKRECKCKVDCKCVRGDCSKSKIMCDRKCSGVAKKVPIEGCGVVDAKAAKGKVKISSCSCDAGEPTGTGSGSGSGSGPGIVLPTVGPITGSGSGPEPIIPTGTGSGSGPIIGAGVECACVGQM